MPGVFAGSRQTVGQADKRLSGSRDGALELPERCALDAACGRPCFEHRGGDLAVVEAGEADDPALSAEPQ